MTIGKAKFVLISLAILACLLGTCAAAQAPPSEEAPVDMSGKWTVNSKGGNGKTGTQHFEIKQNGTSLSGKFIGVHQSGGIEGTVNGKHVIIKTKTRFPMTFRGVYENNVFHGELINPRGTGEFQAQRDSQ